VHSCRYLSVADEFLPLETVNQFIVSLPHDILEYQFFVQTCIILFSFDIYTKKKKKKKKKKVSKMGIPMLCWFYMVSSKNCSFHATRNCVLTLLLVLYVEKEKRKERN
jgi:hypothetical protein